MRIVIEVQDADELRRVTDVLREEGVEIRSGGDGGPSAPAATSEHRQQAFVDALRQFRGVLPPGYTLDRDALHDRDV